MSKIKKCWLAVCLAVAMLAALLPLSFPAVSAAEVAAPADTSAETYAARLFAKLTVSLDGEGGYVRAVVKNDFTLFPSTVAVIVELYSSDERAYDYSDMEWCGTTSIDDLNMGNSIYTRASTGGKQKYWLGRMRYKENGDNWKELCTPVCLFDAEGNFISVA